MTSSRAREPHEPFVLPVTEPPPVEQDSPDADEHNREHGVTPEATTLAEVPVSHRSVRNMRGRTIE